MPPMGMRELKPDGHLAGDVFFCNTAPWGEGFVWVERDESLAEAFPTCYKPAGLLWAVSWGEGDGWWAAFSSCRWWGHVWAGEDAERMAQMVVVLAWAGAARWGSGCLSPLFSGPRAALDVQGKCGLAWLRKVTELVLVLWTNVLGQIKSSSRARPGEMPKASHWIEAWMRVGLFLLSLSLFPFLFPISLSPPFCTSCSSRRLTQSCCLPPGCGEPSRGIPKYGL